MTRALIVGAVCLLAGFGVGHWSAGRSAESDAGSYAEKLAGDLRACEAQLDKGAR